MERHPLTADETVREHPDGTIILVLASPGAKRNEIAGLHAGRLRVATTAKPQNGQANQAIAKLLAKQLGIAKSSCLLLSGSTSRQKRYLLKGISVQSARAKLGLQSP